MKPSFRDKVVKWWSDLRDRVLWSIVKRCVQHIDKMNCGVFMAFTWGTDEVTTFHVIAERSLPDCHVFGTRVRYYDKDGDDNAK